MRDDGFRGSQVLHDAVPFGRGIDGDDLLEMFLSVSKYGGLSHPNFRYTVALDSSVLNSVSSPSKRMGFCRSSNTFWIFGSMVVDCFGVVFAVVEVIDCFVAVAVTIGIVQILGYV